MIAGLIVSLSFQLWRALRLVLDAGLHSKGMSRQEGLDLLAKYAWDTSDIARKEMTQYQSGAGQATAYMIVIKHKDLLRKLIRAFSKKKKMLAVRYSSGLYKFGARAFSTSLPGQAKQNFQFLVVGAGSGGLSISSTLCRKFPHATAIIEPSEVSLEFAPL